MDIDEIKINLDGLNVIFDGILPFPSDVDVGKYWFNFKRTDCLNVTLYFSIYEYCIGIVIFNESDVGILSVNMENCSEIRIIDEEQKILEVLHFEEKRKCLISLLANPILEYEE